jgi:hypothetical protein
MREMIHDMLANSGVNQLARSRQFVDQYGARYDRGAQCHAV